jgi:hypothetical protein
MKLYVLAMVFLAGCSFEKDSFDGGDLSVSGADCGLCGNIPLCTTDACAQSPCTPGCVFAQGPSCPSALPSMIAVSQVTACSGFCGLFTDSNALGCGLYDGNKPGCATCGSAWGAASCVDIDPMIDYQTGGAICQNSTCFDGRPPQDASVNCDMYPHD